MGKKLSQWAKENGVSYITAWTMIKNGQIPYKQLPTGTIVVLDEVTTKDEYTVVYARVSSSENRGNLETQADRVCSFCSAKGWIVKEVIKECGSGVNDNRPKLLKVLGDKKVSRIVVEHKDRLTRFGFNYIQTLCKHNDCEIVVINEAITDKEDLVQDFISIITSFCARIYGNRRSARKTEKIIEELNKEDE